MLDILRRSQQCQSYHRAFISELPIFYAGEYTIILNTYDL